MKRVFLSLICTIVFLCSLTSRCFAISAQSAVVIDGNTGRVLYAQNSKQKMGMASTTKIVTAITALENGELNSVATVSPNAYGVEGSSMYLGLGEKLTLENLLWGLMLVSGNDAATAIAEHISGSVEDFTGLMNSTAAKVGATNSSFTNPHGLSDDSHYTTAHDLAKITAYALKNPKFREIVSTRTKNIPWENHEYDRQLVNHNKFLSMYEGCIGVKTGFTKATGRCLVTAVERDGLTLIAVTLNAPDDWNDHRILYDNAFSEYSSFKVKTQGEIAGITKIKNGSAETVDLVAPADIYVPVKNSEFSKITARTVPFDNLQAPIIKGDTIGTLIVEADGNHLGEFPLVAAESVEPKKTVFNGGSHNLETSLKKVFTAWLTCFF